MGSFIKKNLVDKFINNYLSVNSKLGKRMTEVRAKLLKDLTEEGFEIVETEGTDKYWLIVKDQLSFVWPILISKVRKVTNRLINYEAENEETKEMEWFADEFRIETQAGL
jgi:hypothetical protein